jgi:hypothetical protein
MVNTPTDPALYERIKKDIFSKNPENSAYRSAAIVKKYKQEFFKKYGSSKEPYTGNKKKGKLSQWFQEDWQNQRGGKGYKTSNDVYRPTKRINSSTPKTFSELSKSEISKAMNEKKKLGRVKKF